MKKVKLKRYFKYKIVFCTQYSKRPFTVGFKIPDSYFCPQYSWIFKMYFYCRGACGKFPVKFQGGNISIKDSQLKQENPNSKGEIQGLQWSNIPTDNLTLETSDETPRLVLHATMATYLALKGTMVTEQILPLLVPGHCFFGLKTSGLQYRIWKHFVHFDVRERFINVEDAYFNKRSWNGAQVGELKGEIDKSTALPSSPTLLLQPLSM